LATAKIAMSELCQPHDFAASHALAEAARAIGVEGILVPSCTGFQGGNLVLFPDLPDPASTLTVVQSEDPLLFVSS
jgi:hypothetical protein